MNRIAIPLLTLVIALGLAAAAGAEVPGAATPSPRRWHVGLQTVGSWQSRFDVFDRDDLPPAPIAAHGRGGGFLVGRRFGDRVLAQLQLVFAEHDLADADTTYGDVAVLATGTVLFRTGRTLQPFLRGGIGGGGQTCQLPDDGGSVIAFGPAAVAGGGAHIVLGGRVSLEFEAVATFTDFLQVDDQTEGGLWGGDSWQVRTSNWGWRTGMGLVFWF